MNKLAIVLLFLVTTSALLAETFPISKVTVYRSGASVLRTENINLTAGDNEIEISGLPYNLDLSTSQIFVDPSIKVLSIRTTPDNRIQEEKSQVRSLQDSLEWYTQEAQLIKEQFDLLKKNNTLSTDISTDYAKELALLMDYYKTENVRLRKASIDLKENISRLTTEIKLSQSNSIQQPVSDIIYKKKIIVSLYSESATNTEFGFSYYINEAGLEYRVRFIHVRYMQVKAKK